MVQQMISNAMTGEAEKQILTFTLGSKSGDTRGVVDRNCATDYGVDLLEVQEIRGYTAATPIPNTPSYIKGAMNLRGAVIPVMDLRIRFGANTLDYTKFTVIIVVNVAGKTVGLVADGVSDVLSLRPSNILPPPDFGTATTSDCVDGIVNIEGNLVLMLNLQKMLGPDGIVESSN